MLIGRAARCLAGGSTAAFIAIGMLQKCFSRRVAGSWEAAWLPELKEIISTYGIELKQDGDACRRIRAETASVLKLLIRLNSALSAARSGDYTARTVAELMTDILRATGVLLPLRKGFPTTG